MVKSIQGHGSALPVSASTQLWHGYPTYSISPAAARVGAIQFLKKTFRESFKDIFFKTKSQFVALFKKKMVRNVRDNFFVSAVGGAFESFISMKDPYTERERMNICALFEVLKF